MKTLLQIRASLFSDNGQSSQLADRFVANWRKAHPQGRVIQRDLALQPVPHLDAARFGAFLTKPEDRTAEQAAVIAYSDQLIDDLKSADVMVLGLPMYNFGVPSMLKAYFDHVARAGVTFRYSESGPVGLLSGKQAYVFAARGGLYAGTPKDTQTPYIRTFLGFLGITDVQFTYAEGLNISPAVKEGNLAKARSEIDHLALAEQAVVAAAGP
ncbi:MAG TPA: NAD(P)H-dependent oxidoreductase [Burkholderiales bacterium]